MFQIRIHGRGGQGEIRVREPIMQPDALIIQDPTLKEREIRRSGPLAENVLRETGLITGRAL
jgi:Pyruvate/2-oxoacid:ferredoxin oxidoreductase gamma subunit